MVLTKKSRSELGAARNLFRNAWNELSSDGVQLPESEIHPGEPRPRKIRSAYTAFVKRLSRISDIFLPNIGDIVSSLLLFILFLTIFIAESTGGIFSVNILTNSVALIRSPRCGIYTYVKTPDFYRMQLIASDHGNLYYTKEALPETYNLFYRSTLPYFKVHNDKYPFEGLSYLGTTAYTLDTGLLKA